jgi:hypothetical protein
LKKGGGFMASEQIFIAEINSNSITDEIIRELSHLSEADKMLVLEKIKAQKRLNAAAQIDILLEDAEVLVDEEMIPELVSNSRK